MIDLTGVQHHPALEEIVHVLCNKTQNTDQGFFRAEVAYFLGKIASNMRATIITKDRGEIPVSIYSLALATSGFGKGHSVGIVETEFLQAFKERFTKDTFVVIAEKNLWEIANERAARNGTDAQEEFDRASKEFKRSGAFPFTFDSGTAPAVKQLRSKLLMANCGAVNLQIDEIGSNLVGATEILTVFLELYDQGKTNNKLTKNTNDNPRDEEVDGKTPTNMLLFGTPAKLFDGGATEDQFYSFLEIGYARRCIFGMGHQDKRAFNSLTPTEIYQNLTDKSNNVIVNKWSNHFYDLAAPEMYGWKIVVEDDVAIQLLTYRIACDKLADTLRDHEEIRRTELSHRYFKVLKLAGAYAFIDSSVKIEMHHLMSAILLIEESGAAFQAILTREKAYVKLARYIADVGTEVTHADLLEALPFYKSGTSARNELITLATAWGYKQQILIKKSFVDGIEFFKGETLEKTDLQKLGISYGDHWAYNYMYEAVPFDQLHVLTQTQGMHWANHQFKNGHRAEENVIAGFNTVVLDVDEGVTLDTAAELLKGYKYLIYTTKRHTTENNRFRVILPINYCLLLDAEDYKEFMTMLMGWLPFRVDEQANQRSRKWECFGGGKYIYNMEGEILDALPFIPKTSKNEQYRQVFQQLESLDNLERWFAQRIAMGNRNNNMLRFALALVDNGMDLVTVSKQVHSFNQKLYNPLPEDEINSTILVSVAKRYQSN